VQVARQTRQALSAAGCDVTYREIDDLSHCYPREVNPDILHWLCGSEPSLLNDVDRRSLEELSCRFSWE
jgi:hypothetical protein